MSGADLVSLVAWGGTAVLALCIAAWARYFIIKNGDEDVVASLRLPVATTLALLVVVGVLLAVQPATGT